MTVPIATSPGRSRFWAAAFASPTIPDRAMDLSGLDGRSACPRSRARLTRGCPGIDDARRIRCLHPVGRGGPRAGAEAESRRRIGCARSAEPDRRQANDLRYPAIPSPHRRACSPGLNAGRNDHRSCRTRSGVRFRRTTSRLGMDGPPRAASPSPSIPLIPRDTWTEGWSRFCAATIQFAAPAATAPLLCSPI